MFKAHRDLERDALVWWSWLQRVAYKSVGRWSAVGQIGRHNPVAGIVNEDAGCMQKDRGCRGVRKRGVELQQFQSGSANWRSATQAWSRVRLRSLLSCSGLFLAWSSSLASSRSGQADAVSGGGVWRIGWPGAGQWGPLNCPAAAGSGRAAAWGRVESLPAAQKNEQILACLRWN